MTSTIVNAAVHIGCAAGFSGDRFDAAIPIVADMANREGPKFLLFEVLAERTLALAQRQRRDGQHPGYSPYLDRYIRPILKDAMAGNIRIVSNMGSANPRAAAERIHAIAQELGIAPPRIYIVTGDDMLSYMSEAEITSNPIIEGIDIADRPLIAANAYLGARPIGDALNRKADIVLVGRTTDSALALGPLLHIYNWAKDDWHRLARGTIAGHLLECGAQVSGAYFADPGFKDVPDLANVGFPIAEIDGQGNVTIGKPAGTGGLISKATVTEQLLYEMHDPSAYLTPDVTADITQCSLTQTDTNRVTISGVLGHTPPNQMKATLCVANGWMGEAEMSYAGPNALARARLANEVIEQRMRHAGGNGQIRFDIIGDASAFNGGHLTRPHQEPSNNDGDYRIRAALLSQSRNEAQSIIDEVQSLYCSGPAGGGGFRHHLTEQVATASILVDKEQILPHIHIEEVSP